MRIGVKLPVVRSRTGFVDRHGPFLEVLAVGRAAEAAVA